MRRFALFFNTMPYVDGIIHLEHIDQELPLLTRIPSKVPHKNKAPDTEPWHELHTPDTIKFTLETFEEDFELSGYSKDFNLAKEDLASTVL